MGAELTRSDANGLIEWTTGRTRRAVASALWDGRDNAGRSVPTGVYFLLRLGWDRVRRAAERLVVVR